LRRTMLGTFCLLAAGLLPASVSAEPRRVVSLLPSHTEIVQALGAEGLLVGVSESEKAETLPSLPRAGALAPHWEVLLALRPDLVLADVAHQRYEATFQRFKIPVLFLASTKADDFEDIFVLILEVGKTLAREKEAAALVDGLRRRLAAARARVPSGPGPKAYFEIWPKPLQSCAPVSLQGYLLAQAGAQNIVPPMRKDMPLISLEWVPKQAPEVILHTGVVGSDAIGRRPGWGTIPAVKTGRVYEIDRDLFSRAGPRIVDAFEELLRLLYGGKA